MDTEAKLAHIREFCNTIPVDDPAYETATDIRDFIDGDRERLPPDPGRHRVYRRADETDRKRMKITYRQP